MRDLCQMLGIKKLNTMAYHPECDGMVERFDHTLKSMLRKHAARFGKQWDRFLPGVLCLLQYSTQGYWSSTCTYCLVLTYALPWKQLSYLHWSWNGLYLRITENKWS